MKAYFDLANIESFLSSRDDNPEKFEACNNMLKNHLDVRLNIYFEDFAASDLCLSWVTRLMEEGKNLPKCIVNNTEITPERPIQLQQDFLKSNNIEDHSSLYFVDEDVDAIETHGNYIISNVGNEIATLYKLLFEECTQTIKSLPIRQHFSTSKLWDALEKYTLPCSDIIIVDSYILCNKRLYTNNLYSFTKKITKNVMYSHLNIVIFSLKTTHTRTSSFEPDWDKIRLELKKELQTKDIEANITFVSPETERDFGEHDRTVFTNYIQYIPHACLNFYNTSGDFTSTGRYFHIHSLAAKDNYEATLAFIHDMQCIVNKINSGEIHGAINKDSSIVLSNYLTFQ